MTPVHKNGIHHNDMKLEMVEYTVYRNDILQDTIRIKNPSIQIKNDMTVFSGNTGLNLNLTFSVPTKSINLYGLSLAFTAIYQEFNYNKSKTEAFDKQDKTVVDKYYIENDLDLKAELTLFYVNPSYQQQQITANQTKNSALNYLESISKDYQNLMEAQENKNNAVKDYQMFNRFDRNEKQFSEKFKEYSKNNVTEDHTINAIKTLLKNNIETLNFLLKDK